MIIDSNKTIRTLLEKLKLTKNETQIYLSAVEIGPVKITELAQHARVHRVSAYQIVQQLLQKGLVEVEPKKYGRRISAVTPRRLVGLAVEEEERMHNLTKSLEDIVPELLAPYTEGVKPRVRYLEGVEGFRTLMREIEESGEEYVHIAGSDETLLKTVGREEIEAQILRKDEKGIRRRLLFTQGAWTHEFLTRHPSPMREYRVIPDAPTIPTRCYLYAKHRVAFVAFDPKIMIIIVDDPSIYALQMMLFESLWKQSKKIDGKDVGDGQNNRAVSF